ncbi:LolA-like putative outer membrane lipoprotein chaperone [Dysgonomonas sp. 520]|uniref:LolA family protein n=1 Tax=Dysgonomonas sp. 520 TaxID=2302931 RepID=UPI0013D31F66|nr:LolA-like putative outer membrane lipoprotein chaperone [Dysgonomonas sp. 520]NDW08818.1 hypothetical protein [Dysgonomonas sp. 520]
MKTKILIVLSVLFAQIAVAQNARTILDNASDAFNKAGGVNAKFTVKQENTRTKETFNQNGTAWIKGNKFKFELTDAITWFDGKTQWVYAKRGDEVNVTNPTGEELASISPTALLGMYKSGFNLIYKGEVKDQGRLAYNVEMVPQKKGEVSKFIINIDKQNSQIKSITIINTDGTKATLTITKYQTGVTLTDSTFSFNSKEYPGVDIIDLR